MFSQADRVLWAKILQKCKNKHFSHKLSNPCKSCLQSYSSILPWNNSSFLLNTFSWRLFRLFKELLQTWNCINIFPTTTLVFTLFPYKLLRRKPSFKSSFKEQDIWKNLEDYESHWTEVPYEIWNVRQHFFFFNFTIHFEDIFYVTHTRSLFFVVVSLFVYIGISLILWNFLSQI